MAEITCALTSIQNPTVCNDRGGIRVAYWFDADQVDWATMAGDPLQFNTTNQQVLDYTMLGGGVFHKLTFEPKEAFYDFTYTRETGIYTLLITMLFKAKDIARRNALQSAIACCNIGMHIYGYSGDQRVVGQDWNGVVMSNIPVQLAITRHLDTSGQLGSSNARDELDLGGESFFAPLFANVHEANLPLV